MPELTAVDSPLVNEQRGQAITQRRLRVGINNVTAFAKELRMDRETVVRAEAGRASERTYQQIETWLSRFEEETGHDAPIEATSETAVAGSSPLVEFRIGGNFGVDVVVSGPVENLPELEASVSRLLDRLRTEGGGATGSVAG